MKGGLFHWFDRRLDLRRELSKTLQPHHATWPYLLQSLILFLLILLIATGIILVFSYSPSQPWEGLSQIQGGIIGRFCRRWHILSSHALIVLLLCYGLKAFGDGAYRAPRELSWITGWILAFLCALTYFTGFCLAETAVARATVESAIAILQPLPWLGPWLIAGLGLAHGLTPLAVQRCFVLHTIVLPLAMGIFLLLYIGIRKRQRNFSDRLPPGGKIYG